MFQHRSNEPRQLNVDSKKDWESTLVFSLSHYVMVVLLIETENLRSGEDFGQDVVEMGFEVL